MNRRTNILRLLRRRTGSVGRVVLAWFTLAVLGAGAAPCYAMATLPAVEHAAHAQLAVIHDHAHSAAHDHELPIATDSQLPSAPCPHCPLSVGMASGAETGSHALCAAGDELADGGNASVAVPVLKHLVPIVVGELPLLDPGPSPACSQRRPSVAGAAVALNLRYCVFLI